jgi:hypothetical protein
MKRRDFLKTIGASAAVAAVPTMGKAGDNSELVRQLVDAELLKSDCSPSAFESTMNDLPGTGLARVKRQGSKKSVDNDFGYRWFFDHRVDEAIRNGWELLDVPPSNMGAGNMRLMRLS